MESFYITIEQMFDGYNHSIIQKKSYFNKPGLMISLMGVISFVMAPYLSHLNEAAYASAILLGLALCFWGFIKVLSGRKSYTYVPSMSKIKIRELNFHRDKIIELENILKEERFSSLKEMLCKIDNGVKLVVAISADGEYSAYQVMKFIPYEYKTHSSVIELTGDRSKNFIDQISDILKTT